ncbi:WYL domain-containing protein [uncultured Paracoccus sp.]|uniref:WYL domain-containing protein n=1 Tax=uncultured Paracoccus sp. TaxID=189685 RepID=UPI00342550F3
MCGGRQEYNNGTIISARKKALKAPIQNIDYAISADKDLILSYTDEARNITERYVTPLRRYNESPPGSRKWLEAYCHLRNEGRTFRMDRINSCKPVKRKKEQSLVTPRKRPAPR